jgi:hypothetical protein
MELEIIIAVLVQWMKYRKLLPKYEHLVNDEIVEELTGEFHNLRDRCVADNIKLTFGDTVKFILQQTSRKSPALIINLDEAQKLGAWLQNALEILSKPLLTQNSRVFVTITGISKASLRDAIEQSSVSIKHIFLPILKDKHISSILEKIFVLQENQLPSSIMNATKWLGGVPRFLEYFLRSVAKKACATTVSEVWDWLKSATSNELMDAIALTSHIISELILSSHEVSSDLLDNIFSLSVSERPVRLQQIISPEWTVERAQGNSLLYWRVTSGGFGIVIVPPIILNLIHINCGRRGGASIHALKRPSVTMTVDDNESLAISALLHKLKAAAIVGCETVDFYKDLIGAEGFGDRSVTVPKCFNYHVLSEQVTEGTFEVTKLETLERSRINPTSTPIAFVNGRSAPFADAFIIFPELVIFIQEKQSTKSRQKNASGWNRKSQFRPGPVVDEKNKVGNAMITTDFFFMYQTIRVEEYLLSLIIIQSLSQLSATTNCLAIF